MKYFVVTYTTRDGDHEYGDLMLSKADNADIAEIYVKKELIDLYGEGQNGFDEEGKLDLYDQIIQIDSTTEILETDFAVLQKYHLVTNRVVV